MMELELCSLFIVSTLELCSLFIANVTSDLQVLKLKQNSEPFQYYSLHYSDQRKKHSGDFVRKSTVGL